MNYSEIEKKIGYTFQDKSLLEKAFIHSSLGRENNERLEYLGDAVLELIVTEDQYLKGEMPEGVMSSERQTLVDKTALLTIVEELGLKKYLLFKGTEQNVGKKTVSSIFEATVAAIYLDGGYEKAKAFVLPFIPRLKKMGRENYISLLQERLQKTGLPLPVYDCWSEGPSHKPKHFAKVCACNQSGFGEGLDKTAAKQAAAKELLNKLKKISKEGI